MMKLNFRLLDAPIELKPVTFLVTEDSRVFANIVKLFYEYDEEKELKIFDSCQKQLKASEILKVTDVLGFDINSSANLKLIYADLEGKLNEKPEIKSEIERLAGNIGNIISYELLEHELDLAGDEITFNEIFKALDINVETCGDSIFEKLLEIIQVYKYLSKKRLLVLVNVCAYLSEEELKELYEYITLFNIEMLFLEPRKIKGVSQYILDEDYFLYEENVV